MLVCPNRVAERYKDLHPEEISDLFVVAQKVSKAVELFYNATSVTMAVQVSTHIYLFLQGPGLLSHLFLTHPLHKGDHPPPNMLSIDFWDFNLYNKLPRDLKIGSL